MSVPTSAYLLDVSELRAGLYEQLLTHELVGRLRQLSPNISTEIENVDPADVPHVLARHLHDAIVRALASVPEKERVESANELLELLTRTPGVEEGDRVQDGPRQLLSIWQPPVPGTKPPARPGIPLSNSALLVNGPRDHRIGQEICSELESADRVDLLCAFLKWNGLRIVRDALNCFLARGGRMRVITTSYLGATDRRVVDELVRLGRQAVREGQEPAVEIKISYDTRGTRLHAKAWLFHRDSGFSTACIGSSNMSTHAFIEGIEWNVRVTAVDVPHILKKFQGTFDSYWEDPDFESYDPDRDRDRFDRAVQDERSAGHRADPLAFVDVHPYPFQREILERLRVEREVHGRHRNLIVAATGTGKTMIAAFDYRRIRQQRGTQHDRLLFVAHRDHILSQALARFRVVLKDEQFGELWDGNHKPQHGQHIFASIQTLKNQPLDTIDPEQFDVVIVDEFHHAAAPTYRRVLDYLRPAILLGLTATPERADELDVLHWFDHHIAAQLRLWQALERQFLTPFQYFGLADATDLRAVEWKRGAYDLKQLSQMYTGNHARVLRILQAIERHVLDPRRMRAIAFCVDVAHAHFMSEEFNRRGLPARAITGATPSDERREVIAQLRTGAVNVVFNVDVFTEGVDIPEIDTVLMLRPTESATVFQQQLGRGLRKYEGKDCLTVLDFIGLAHRRFRFDQRLATIVPGTRAELARSVEQQFPFLPSGCSIQLDAEAQQIVLDNLRASVLRENWLVDELRAAGDVSLLEFITRAEIDVRDIYGRDRSWTQLRQHAGLPAGDAQHPLLKGVRRLLHMDSLDRIRFYRDVLNGAAIEGEVQVRRWTMLHVVLFSGSRPTLEDGLAAIREIRDELLAVLDVLEERIEHFTRALELPDVPLQVHATYALDEILAAFGRLTADGGTRIREGVMHDATSGNDVLFITLQKSEKHYSPTTMYRDYAISPALVHWESQSFIRADSPTGRRYRQHGRASGTHALLFVRDTKDGPYGSTSPYVFVGPADYVRHEGERPMGIVWSLHHELPAWLFERARMAA